MKTNQELESVISLTVHKSIYRHMHLRLEIDLVKVNSEGCYGTGISNILNHAQINLQLHGFVTGN